MIIGKIVKSCSHINYICQIYGPLEIETPPDIAEYAFGRFVRVVVPPRMSDLPRYGKETNQDRDEEPFCHAVGVIYDTQLLNPAFGSLGPRLSNETQVEVFSPDYLAEKAVLVHLLMLGMVEHQKSAGGSFKSCIVHGIPSFPLELNSSVETMIDEEVHGFHFFHDQGNAVNHEYIHMGYLPHMIAQQNSLIPQVILRIIDQLEILFPQHCALLSILKRNFAWRLKVETAG